MDPVGVALFPSGSPLWEGFLVGEALRLDRPPKRENSLKAHRPQGLGALAPKGRLPSVYDQ